MESGIDFNASLGTSVRKACDGVFDGHEGGESFNLLQVDAAGISSSTLCWQSVAFMLDAISFDDFDQPSVYLEQRLPVLKGMLNLREKSGDLRKLSRSLGMPAASPALSKYSETI